MYVEESGGTVDIDLLVYVYELKRKSYAYKKSEDSQVCVCGIHKNIKVEAISN